VVRDGDDALFITEKNAWKVKRIPNTPRVTVAICDMRGNVKSEPVEAVATVLDDPLDIATTGNVAGALGLRTPALCMLTG
jgi:PPOX class probable F420-dependent enzyme